MLVDASGGVIAQEGLPVPPPWDVRESSKYTGRFYFFNTINGESKWSLPPELLLEAKHAVVISANSRASTSVSSDVGNSSARDAASRSESVPGVASALPRRKKTTAKSSAIAERLAAWEQTTTAGTNESPVQTIAQHGSRGRSAPPRSPGRFSSDNNRNAGQSELSTPERLHQARERQTAKPNGSDSYDKGPIAKEDQEPFVRGAPKPRGRAHSVATRRFQWPPAPPNLKTNAPQQNSSTDVQSPPVAPQSSSAGERISFPAPQNYPQAPQNPLKADSRSHSQLANAMARKAPIAEPNEVPIKHKESSPQVSSPPMSASESTSDAAVSPSSPIATEAATLDVPRGRGRAAESRGREGGSGIRSSAMVSKQSTERGSEGEDRGGRGSSLDAARRSAFGLLPSPSSPASNAKRNFIVTRSQSTAAPRPRHSIATPQAEEKAVSPGKVPQQQPSVTSPPVASAQTIGTARDSPSLPSEHAASNVPTAFRRSSPVSINASTSARSKGKLAAVVAARRMARTSSSQPNSPSALTPSAVVSPLVNLPQSSSTANEPNARTQNATNASGSTSSTGGNGSSSSRGNSGATKGNPKIAPNVSLRQKDHSNTTTGMASPEERRASPSCGRTPAAAPSSDKCDYPMRGTSMERPPTSPNDRTRSAFGLLGPSNRARGQVAKVDGGAMTTSISSEPPRSKEGATNPEAALESFTSEAVTSSSKGAQSPTKKSNHDSALSRQSLEPSPSRTSIDDFSTDIALKNSGLLSSMESFDTSSLEVVGGLGQGTFACVVAVQARSTKKPSEESQHFAMKVIAKSGIARHRDRERLEFELRAMTEVPFSPFLQRCVAAFESATDIFFVVDLASGGDLFYHLASKIKEGGGGFTETEGRSLLSEVVLGLNHLHNHGFVHRDVKVENVILDQSGHVKLVDFGLACALNEPATIATGSAGVGSSAAGALAAAGQAEAKNSNSCWEEPMALTGSLIYMAPELLERQRGGRQTDWWALGVLTHEILTGRSPWSSLNDKQIIRREICSLPVLPPAGLSRSCGQFVCSLLRQDYRHRLGTRNNSEILAHPYFKTVDWAALREGRGPPVLPSSFKEQGSNSSSEVSCVASASAGDRALALAAYLMKGSSTINEKQTRSSDKEKEGEPWYLGLKVVKKHPEVASGAVAKAAAEAAAEETETGDGTRGI